MGSTFGEGVGGEKEGKRRKGGTARPSNARRNREKRKRGKHGTDLICTIGRRGGKEAIRCDRKLEKKKRKFSVALSVFPGKKKGKKRGRWPPKEGDFVLKRGFGRPIEKGDKEHYYRHDQRDGKRKKRPCLILKKKGEEGGVFLRKRGGKGGPLKRERDARSTKEILKEKGALGNPRSRKRKEEKVSSSMISGGK